MAAASFMTPAGAFLRALGRHAIPQHGTPSLIFCRSRCSSSGLQAPSPSCRRVITASDSRYGGKQIICLDGPLYEYLLAHTREPQILSDLREETSNMIGSQMQASPDQGQFLAMLVRLIGAARCIEVGMFTGYSALAVALALPAWGHLVACEKDEKSLEVARKYIKLAGVSEKVDIRQGMALATLNRLLDDGGASSYDFAFLDADKRKYSEYYELLLQLLRPGGLLVVDNVLWHGRVIDKQDTDKRTQSLRDFNALLLHDRRVDISMEGQELSPLKGYSFLLLTIHQKTAALTKVEYLQYLDDKAKTN